MLTKRALLLTISGLLAGYLAAAQTPANGPSPTATSANADMMSWMLGGVLCLAGYVTVLAAITLVTASSARRSVGQGTPAGGPTAPATSATQGAATW